MRYYGLNQLDRLIEPFVDFDGGVFFEAGANDGLNQSNTAHLELDRGWTGVLVEPSPLRFEALCRNRPASRCLRAALTAPDYGQAEVPLVYCDLMTVTRGGAELALDPERHVASGVQWLRQGDAVHEFTAPARTISSILDECGVGRVDLLSLDIEGYEHVALRGLDTARHEVRFICVEAWDLPRILQALGPRYRVREKLSYHDYLLERVG
jgi:FkbM family methyltransferase